MRLGLRRIVLCSLLSLSACSDGEDDDDLPDGSVDPSTVDDSGADAAPPPPPPNCGDGMRAAPEECDDGNLGEGDGCSPRCTREVGFNCAESGGACMPVCGDSLLAAGELCDDGNTTAGDGCSQTCTLEAGWSCLMSGERCSAASCGDGLIAGNEQCDDGNQIPGDGCSTVCMIEAGWVCLAARTPCTADRCGDGVRAGMEACDDGNVASGDGCTADCSAVEPNYGCPDLGGACRRTSVCGNGVLTSDEQCDDRNTTSGDGCSATCTSEAGYHCAMVGRSCTAASCGDGIIAGSEQCEDQNATPGDGCHECQVETGWACAMESGKSVCHRAVCGDSKVEGEEACDDGNDVVGDGCGPFCRTEPRCQPGQPCTSTCGDGIKLASDEEACDDGNARNGDGCSADCKIERGYTCTDVLGTLPTTFDLTVVFRDFIRRVPAGLTGYANHPDFEAFYGFDATEGIVADTLAAGGKPGYTGKCEKGSMNAGNMSVCPYGPQSTSAANFGQWYADAEVPNVMKKFVQRLTMNRMPTGTAFQNATFGQQLFPLDGKGWVATQVNGRTVEEGAGGHNYNFTSEIRHWFEFKGGEVLTFSGDDDLWVFINGKLALDLGGLHAKQSRTIVLDAATGSATCYLDHGMASQRLCKENGGKPRALGIVPNRVYEMALFHAERATSQSNFDLTLTGFIAARSECKSSCGDGVVTVDEVCDEGKACQGGDNAGKECSDAGGCPGGSCVSRNDGSYGHCAADCQSYGPHCGDATLQMGEACDLGFEKNHGGYDGCTQDCKLGPRCGDSRTDGAYGEQCDLGTDGNNGTYNGCTDRCRFAERCGDGVMQAGELCDDGMNRSQYGGCGAGCKPAPRCGDGVRDRVEQCDDGAAANDGHYGGCGMDCKRAPYCGDGKVDAAEGESCDDGNANDFDGCSPTCKQPLVI